MLIQDVDRAQEAERSLLGSVLLDPSTITIASGVVKANDFCTGAHKLIFQTMLDLDNAEKPIDLATLTAKLFGQPLFEEIGGIHYLGELTQRLPTAANIDRFAEIVRSQSILRQLSAMGDSIKKLSTEPVEDIDQTVAQLSDEILELSMESGSDSWISFSDAVKETINRLMNPGEGIPPVMTGFVDLDRKLAGLRPGTLTIIAARPGMGKTALGLNIASNVASTQGRPVAFFSLEMSKQEVGDRIISSMSSVQGNAIRNASLTPEEWERLLNAAELYSKSRIYIDETPALDILALREKAKRMQRKHGIDIILVDYLQLMTSKSRKVFNREQEIADISRGLKRIAKELHIPVIAMAQLNRSLETRIEKRPMLSDLRESGSIEQDADNVIFIHREDYYKRGGENDNVAEIIVAKQRSGPPGTVKLHWDGQFTRFSSLEQDNYYNGY